LKFCYFQPGAKIFKNSKFYQISDPLKNPSEFHKTLFSPLATISDKLKIIYLKQILSNFDSNDILNDIDISTKNYLSEFGFSKKFIKFFFQPFFGGIFLERELSTSSSFFKFVFSKFSNGNVVIPKQGIQEIPNQLFKNINNEKVLFNKKVTLLDKDKVFFENGTSIQFNKLVLAGDTNLVNESSINYHSVKCFYFSFNEKLSSDKYIHLFPEDNLINNVVFISDISPDYAPLDHSLLSVTLIGNFIKTDNLIKVIQKKLSYFYKINLRKIKFLKEYQIEKALPVQPMGCFNKKNESSKNIFMAGDHTTHSSIEGAFLSGKKIAEKLLNL